MLIQLPRIIFPKIIFHPGRKLLGCLLLALMAALSPAARAAEVNLEREFAISPDSANTKAAPLLDVGLLGPVNVLREENASLKKE